MSPASGLAQVPINAQIVVAFNEPVNSESLKQVTLKANGTPVGLTATLSNGNQMLTLVPAAGLTASTAYTLTVAGVTDLSGNAMAASFTSTFTTSAAADLKAPVVAMVTPSNGTTGVLSNAAINVTFNKNMNPLSISTLTFTCTPSGGTVLSGTIFISPDGTTASLNPSAGLAKSTTYTVKLTTSIMDLEGQALTGFTSTFVTAAQ